MQNATAPKRPDARKVRSRVAMRAALLALLSETSLDAVTGAMVADRAGVGYSTFFRHYADVRALLVDTVGALTDDLAQVMMPAILRQQSATAAQALIDAVDIRREPVRALLAGAGDALRAELGRQVINRLATLPTLSAAWLPPALAIRIAVASTIELLDWWLNEEPQRDATSVSELLTALVIRPLMTGDRG